MRYLADIKSKLYEGNKVAIQMLLLILSVYVFIMSQFNSIWKVPILFLGLLIWFFLRDKTKHPIIWLVFLTLLLCDFWHSYFWVANHHFMITFIVLSVIAYMYHQRKEVLQKNIQIILVIVILTSVVQKLMSNQFTSGNFYYFMINKGVLFQFIMKFFPESLEVVKSNSESYLNLWETNPNDGQTIVFKNITPNIGYISLLFAKITIAFEFIVAMAILWKPKKTWAHLLLILMIFGVLLTRLETAFMAILASCGLFLCSNYKLKLSYILIVLGCVTLMVTKVGYH